MLILPPQHGKTRTLINFIDWVLGKNNEERIIFGSYNEDTSNDAGRFARDGITEVKNVQDDIVFSDIFPNTMMKHGNKSYRKWALKGQHFNFIATSPGGTSTGKGATLKIIDDLVKGAEEALNETHLQKLDMWVVGTLGSRNAAVGGGEPLEIMCGTAWSKNDPQHKALKDEPGEWFVLKMPVFDEDTGKMLCSDFMSKKVYDKRKSRAFKNPLTKIIFQANYHGEIIDVAGRLYPTLNTYEKVPVDSSGYPLFEIIKAYGDTADEGSDYLCVGIYGVYQKKAYMLDVYYTKAGMEITEPETAKRLVDFNVNIADIESNNGGRGFARNLQRIMQDDLIINSVKVHWFHQSHNKKARILSKSANVQEDVLFPVDWMNRWPEFYDHVTSYQKEGKHKNDDAEDMLTGIVEKMENKTLRFG